MAQFITGIFATFATVPFLSFFVIYLIALIKTKSKKESVQWAIHITMVLLLFSIGGMARTITGSTALLWWLIVIVLLFGGLLAYLQWKKRQIILLGRLLRSVWYLAFFLFMITYIILIPIGIIHYYGKV